MEQNETPTPTVPPTTAIVVSDGTVQRSKNPALIYLASLSPTGRRTQGQVISVMAGWLGGDVDTIRWGRLRYEHTAALMSLTAEQGYSVASRQKFACALRGILLSAWRLGQITAEDRAKAADLGHIRGSTEPRGRYIDEAAFLRILNVCMADPSPAGYRDVALLATMYSTGLRRDEVTGLTMADISYDIPDTISLLVRGKGKKERITYLTNGAANAMRDWLVVRGEWPGNIFVAIRRNGVIVDRRMTGQAVYVILDTRRKEAGLEKFSPHDFRHTNISNLLNVADVVEVARMVGHSSPTTTMRYDRRPQAHQAETAAKLTIPYTRRLVPKSQQPPAPAPTPEPTGGD